MISTATVNLESIGYLLGIHAYYKPETPCWWTWQRLHQMTDTTWERGRMIDAERMLWLGIRQALIVALGAIERFLGLPQSIEPRHKRE